MRIESFEARDFRCLANINLEPDPRFNLIVGPNASGKTSILEAIGYLARGKSFRGAPPSGLIRHGQNEFVLLGKVLDNAHRSTLGVRNGPGGLETRVDGEGSGGSAALAAALPLQIIDPDVHDLVAGAPDERRRYLDWLAFHVEHGYLETWRRFRRSLKQRNAALRAGATPAVIAGWNAQFCRHAHAVDRGRRAALSVASAALGDAARELLGREAQFEYRPGWAEEKGLASVLEASIGRDLQQGSTQFGPHRADLKVAQDARQARKLVSRGQQKLLACAMVLAATQAVQEVLEKPLVLLLDDPAAELDRESLSRLMRRVEALDCQVIATSLVPDAGIFADAAAVFHVEHGCLRSAS